MWFNSNFEEYSTKVDGYYYDKKINMMKVILKIRNKRTTLTLLVKNLLLNRDLLSTLHPIDLCIIAVLASENKMVQTNCFKPAPDNYLMIKIKPVIEIVNREFIENKEILHLKIKGINKKTTLTAQELFNNKKLMSALEYYDALSVGFSIASSGEHLAIENHNENFNIIIYAQQGIGLMLLIFSVLFSGTSLAIYLFGKTFNLEAELLTFPILLTCQIENLKKLPTILNNQFIIGSVLILIMFYLYFSWITNLPYPLNNLQTPFFNQLFNGLKYRTLCYILGFYIMNIIINQTFYLTQAFSKIYYWIVDKDLLIKLFAIFLFFLTAKICGCLLNIKSYSFSDFFYLIFFTFIFHASQMIMRNLFARR